MSTNNTYVIAMVNRGPRRHSGSDTMAMAAFHHQIPPPRPSPQPPVDKKKQHLLLRPHLLHLPSNSNNTLLRKTSPSSASTPRLNEPPFHEKLEFLETELGVDPLRALSVKPELRSLPFQHLHRLHSIFLSFGLQLPADSSRILVMLPDLLTSPPDLFLLPSLRFLRHSVPLPRPRDLRLAVLRCPRLLLSSVDHQLLPSLHFLRRLGFHHITPATTLLLVSSVEETLIPKLDYLQSLGFSHWQAVHLVRRNPALFTYSVERNFRPKVQFLVGEMGKDVVVEVRRFPQYFSFSLEGRIKPRYRSLLRLGIRMSLRDMLRPSDGEFQDRLVEMRLAFVEERWRRKSPGM